MIAVAVDALRRGRAAHGPLHILRWRHAESCQHDPARSRVELAGIAAPAAGIGLCRQWRPRYPNRVGDLLQPERPVTIIMLTLAYLPLPPDATERAPRPPSAAVRVRGGSRALLRGPANALTKDKRQLQIQTPLKMEMESRLQGHDPCSIRAGTDMHSVQKPKKKKTAACSGSSQPCTLSPPPPPPPPPGTRFRAGLQCQSTPSPAAGVATPGSDRNGLSREIPTAHYPPRALSACLTKASHPLDAPPLLLSSKSQPRRAQSWQFICVPLATSRGRQCSQASQVLSLSEPPTPFHHRRRLQMFRWHGVMGVEPSTAQSVARARPHSLTHSLTPLCCFPCLVPRSLLSHALLRQ